MAWLNLPWGRRSASSRVESCSSIRLALPGWTEGPPADEGRTWRDDDGDMLSLTFLEKVDLPRGSNETKLRNWCREIATGREGGLLEAQAMTCEMGRSVAFVYKRMQVPHTGYTYTGMLITSIRSGILIWMVVACERGTSGLREAVVTANLVQAGELTVEDYERRWAQDPYEPAFQGVDRIVLRFLSDDRNYDAQFPHHALSKVRRVLAALPEHVRF